MFFYRGRFPNGSHGVRLRLMCEGLKEHEIGTRVLIAYPPPQADEALDARKNEEFLLAPVSRALTAPEKIAKKLFGTFRAYRRLKRMENILAVVQVGLGFLEGYLVRRYCRANGVKFFVEANDMNRWEATEKKLTFTEWLALRHNRLFEKMILKDADVIFVVSSYLEKMYRQKVPHVKIKRILPTFVTIRSFATTSPPEYPDKYRDVLKILSSEETKVLYAGSCVETNGLKFFLQCSSEVIQSNKLECRIILLLFLGRIDEVRRFVASLPIAGNVHIEEDVPIKYIPSLYAKADILVIPEMGDVIAHAGFPGKTGEYLASGKAILSTIFSDIDEYLIHEYNAMLSHIGDKEKYCDNLLRLVNDRALRLTLGRNAVLTARQHFDCKQGTRTIVEELQED